MSKISKVLFSQDIAILQLNASAIDPGRNVCLEPRRSRHGYALFFSFRMSYLDFGRRIRVSNAKLYVEFSLRSYSITHILPTDNVGDKICIFGFSRGAYTARR